MSGLENLSDAEIMQRYEMSQKQPGLKITVRPPGVGDNPVGVGEDIARSGWSGMNAGVAGLVGLPDTLSSLGAAGIDKLSRGAAGLLGIDYQKPNLSGGLLEKMLPSAKGTQGVLEQYVPGADYKPQTTAGQYAHTVGEMVPGAMAGPGGMAGNVLKYGVLPGLASESAGQYTKGGESEKYARPAAALLTGGLAGAMSRPGTANQSIRQQMPAGVNQQTITQAEALMADAAARGVTLSWPEALSQVAGRPVLSDMARHLEASGPTQGRMADFYANRPQEVERAGRYGMGIIAPPNNAPSNIGHAAGEVMEGAVHDARGNINAAARPHYQASETVLLNPTEMAQVRAVPGYAEAARDVRNTTQLNRYVSHLPENSVGFLNEVKKRLDWQARNAAAPISPQGVPNQQIAGGLTSDAAAVRQAGIDATGGATGPYATALSIEEQGRRALDRVLEGPIGKMASKDTTTKQAIEALFPKDPLANSAREITTAVGALANRSPRVARDLVRAHAESVFNHAISSNIPGANPAGGAKFVKELVGNPQQRANLEAAVTALPQGAIRWEGFNRILDILQATGTRQNIGSKTAYNAEFLKEAASSGVVGEAVKGAANPVSRFTTGLIDRYERYRLGRNLNELADVLTNPAAVGQLRTIARLPPGSRNAEALALRILTLGNASTQPSQNVQQPGQ